MSYNEWCRTLGIEPPDLDAVKDHREANTYARLIVALLERGEPMTLVEVAERLERVGVAHFDRALRSLQRCKPGRAPVYRDGDQYSLDPHDDELDEAWKDASLHSWSGQRLALAVLDAHAGRPMCPRDAIAFVADRTAWHGLRDDSSRFRRKGCPIAVGNDGRWSIAPDTEDALRAMRRAVRARVETARRHASARPDPSVMSRNARPQSEDELPTLWSSRR